MNHVKVKYRLQILSYGMRLKKMVTDVFPVNRILYSKMFRKTSFRKMEKKIRSGSISSFLDFGAVM